MERIAPPDRRELERIAPPDKRELERIAPGLTIFFGLKPYKNRARSFLCLFFGFVCVVLTQLEHLAQSLHCLSLSATLLFDGDTHQRGGISCLRYLLG